MAQGSLTHIHGIRAGQSCDKYVYVYDKTPPSPPPREAPADRPPAPSSGDLPKTAPAQMLCGHGSSRPTPDLAPRLNLAARMTSQLNCIFNQYGTCQAVRDGAAQ